MGNGVYRTKGSREFWGCLFLAKKTKTNSGGKKKKSNNNSGEKRLNVFIVRGEGKKTGKFWRGKG